VPDVTVQASMRTIPPQAANSQVEEHMTERVDPFHAPFWVAGWVNDVASVGLRDVTA
jgi:hypothetical protein